MGTSSNADYREHCYGQMIEYIKTVRSRLISTSRGTDVVRVLEGAENEAHVFVEKSAPGLSCRNRA